MEELRQFADKTSVDLSMTTSKGISNSNYIRELTNRSEELHKGLEKC